MLARTGLTAGLALALVALSSGCQTLVSSYWDDVKETAPGDSGGEEPRHEAPHVHFLGVRASDQVAPYQVGVKLLHVFGASPAARAGLEAGDELRMLDGKPVRTASDVRAALAATQGGDRETVPIVYARDGQEYQGNVDLVTWDAYVAARRGRLFAEAAFEQSEFPFAFRWSARAITPAFLELYYGIKVDEPVRVYADLTLLPLIPGVAVFRRESLALVGGSRTQIWHWPLRFTTGGEDRTSDLHGLVPPPPDDTSDL